MTGHSCNQPTLSTFQVIICLHQVYFHCLVFSNTAHLTLPPPVLSSSARSSRFFWCLQISVNHVGLQPLNHLLLCPAWSLFNPQQSQFPDKAQKKVLVSLLFHPPPPLPTSLKKQIWKSGRFLFWHLSLSPLDGTCVQAISLWTKTSIFL